VGHALNDATFQNFEILPTEQKSNLLRQYYTENFPPSASEPIYLNQTTLVDQKAFAGEFSNTADLIIKRNHTNSLDEVYSDVGENQTEVAFLYKFQKRKIELTEIVEHREDMVLKLPVNALKKISKKLVSEKKEVEVDIVK
jgi:hypothetical protein